MAVLLQLIFPVNENALHKDSPWRQGEGGDESIRPDER